MAGHSQFKNIMYRKGAQDAKRARIFARFTREITVAARAGLPDPASNSRLRNAIIAARAQNMPKDNIERAIKRSQGADADNFDEVRYEGFGPGGVAVIVEALSDNRNRTASSIRAAFSKNGGNLGESGSVAYMFDHVGAIRYNTAIASSEKVFEAALEAGANDCVSSDSGHEILCDVQDLQTVQDELEHSLGAAESVRIVWKAQNLVAIDEDQARTLFKLLDILDDDDDVQNVFVNFDVADEIMEKLSA